MRINDSIARNPTFSFDTPRFLTAYAEATFPLAFFESNQTANTTLNTTLESARSFFEFHRFPEGFYRREGPYDFPQVSVVFNLVANLVGVLPGRNEGVGNYVLNPEDDGSVRHLWLAWRARAERHWSLDVLCIPQTGQFNDRTVPKPNARARGCDQG